MRVTFPYIPEERYASNPPFVTLGVGGGVYIGVGFAGGKGLSVYEGVLGPADSVGVGLKATFSSSFIRPMM